MKVEYGKYYLLDLNQEYWSIDLQRRIKFCDKLVVKYTQSFQDKIYFGYIIKTSEIYDDIVTDNEIMFSEKDVIKKYKLYKAPLIFFDI